MGDLYTGSLARALLFERPNPRSFHVSGLLGKASGSIIACFLINNMKHTSSNTFIHVYEAGVASADVTAFGC